MRDLASLSIIIHRESLASRVKYGHDWSVVWGWNFFRHPMWPPYRPRLKRTAPDQTLRSRVQLRNCRESVTAKEGVEKRKTLASVGNELVCFSSQTPPWQTGRMCVLISNNVVTSRLIRAYSTESIWWSLHHHLTYLIDFSISSHRHASPNDFPRTLDDFPLTSAGFHLERPLSPAAPIVTTSNPCLINLCQSLYRAARRLMQTNHSNSCQPNRIRLGFCFRTNLISEMISKSLTLCIEWITAVPY